MQLPSSLVFLAVASTTILVLTGAATKDEICEKCSTIETVASSQELAVETTESPASTTDNGPLIENVETAKEITEHFESTTETSPFSASTWGSSPLGPIPLKGDDAELAENAQFICRLSPPKKKWAYCSLKATEIFPLGFLVKFAATIRVSTNDRRRGSALRGEKTGSRLQIRVNGKSVYDEELVTTGGKFQEVASDTFASSENPRIDMVQKNGDKIIDLTVKGPALVFDSESSRTELPESTSTDSSLKVTGSGPTGADSADRETHSSMAWIAGPVIGGCVGLALVVGVAFLFRRRLAKRTRPEDAGGPGESYEKPELHADCVAQNPQEAEVQAVYEMQGSIPQPSEMATNEVRSQELPGKAT
ncbi:hypothetical protein MRS44_018116 [Fusarium solani]|uniref:uncharacterized protein n=1 Tax=Fusarium solani TaxID=169388 RepID=UPI0032C455A3|nr:hypothetical protein MRS44_018116 [Fusarium solani]